MIDLINIITILMTNLFKMDYREKKTVNYRKSLFFLISLHSFPAGLQGKSEINWESPFLDVV